LSAQDTWQSRLVGAQRAIPNKFFHPGVDEVDTLFLKNGCDVQKSVCRGSTLTLYESIGIVRPFMSELQWSVLKNYCTDHEEGEHFRRVVCALAKRIEETPITFEQDGRSDTAVAYLHYFKGASDWYVIERPALGSIHQAFGYTVVNGEFEKGELAYFNISELIAQRVELDLHFSSMTLDSVKREQPTRRVTVSDHTKEMSLIHAALPVRIRRERGCAYE
jgi:hypothetical protein